MYVPNPNQSGGEEPGGVPTGTCTCEKWTVEVPDEDQPLRRLLLALREAVQELPPEAVKKFEDELKDAEKESQGILPAVNKYREFYDKLDCRLAEARTWKADIARWLVGKIDERTKQAVRSFRAEYYDDVERTICCDWIALRDRLNGMRDCLVQAQRTEEERKKDYDDFKAFEKTLGERFTQLKSLYDQAKSLLAEQRYKAVFAVSLEYKEVYDNLGLFRDWDYARSQCRTPGAGSDAETVEEEEAAAEGGGYGSRGTTETETTEGEAHGEQQAAEGGGDAYGAGGLKRRWTPEQFKTTLTSNLRKLILAKYQRFRWQYEFQSAAADAERGERACAAFRDERMKQFVEEADEVPVLGADAGGGDETSQQPAGGDPRQSSAGGGYTPPTGGYTPPAGGGRQQKPPAGNYPDIPQPPTPGGYHEADQQPDTYQGRPKK